MHGKSACRESEVEGMDMAGRGIAKAQEQTGQHGAAFSLPDSLCFTAGLALAPGGQPQGGSEQGVQSMCNKQWFYYKHRGFQTRP